MVDRGGVRGEEELHDGVVAAVDGFVERRPAARVECGWGSAIGEEMGGETVVCGYNGPEEGGEGRALVVELQGRALREDKING